MEKTACLFWPVRKNLFLALLLFVAPFASAQLDDEPALLPPEQAFAVSAFSEKDADGKHYIVLDFNIAEGYYLYRDKLAFATDSIRLALGLPDLPEGISHRDEFFGEVAIYRGLVQGRLPVVLLDNEPAPFSLLVSLQGCSESPAICYPPHLARLPVDLGASLSSAPVSTTAGGDSLSSPALTPQIDVPLFGAVNERQFRQGNYFVLLPLFLLLGLLLAFTPCVLPMLPVLSGIVAGNEKRGAFWLSLSYVLAMSLAYAGAGVVAAVLGVGLQAWLQSPAALIFAAVIVVLLGLAMLDFWQLRLPAAWSGRLSAIDFSRRSGPVRAAGLGILGALVLSPCVSPPLVAVLVYVAGTGDIVLGGSALFFMGLGIGLPLLLWGTVLGAGLPRAGAWMREIKRLFAVLLFATALWLVSSLLPQAVGLLLIAALCLGAALWLWSLRFFPLRVFALVLIVWSVLAAIGAATGTGSFLRPLQGLVKAEYRSHGLVMEDITDLSSLRSRLLAAGTRPVLVDFYADWCLSCRELENTTFAAEEVAALVERRDMVVLRADVTRSNAASRELLKTFGLFGPPAVLFFQNRREVESLRLIGYENAENFKRRIAYFSEA